jgi:hypothetical protein
VGDIRVIIIDLVMVGEKSESRPTGGHCAYVCFGGLSRLFPTLLADGSVVLNNGDEFCEVLGRWFSGKKIVGYFRHPKQGSLRR